MARLGNPGRRYPTTRYHLHVEYTQRDGAENGPCDVIVNTEDGSYGNGKGGFHGDEKEGDEMRGKSMYRGYITGTMPDLHRFLQKYPTALIISGFLRGCGMFYGVSSPVMGACGLAAAVCDSWYNLIFLSWSVAWSMVWSFVLGVPRELILNGLYPSQGIILSYAMMVTYGTKPSAEMLTQLVALVPLLYFNIIFFQALCNVFVNKLHVTPMMVSGLTLGVAWQLAIQKSNHFYTNIQIPILIQPLGPNMTSNIAFMDRDWFDIEPSQYLKEILFGVSMLQFSASKWSSIPICIGLATVSPIMFVTTWLGSFVGISTVACLRPEWNLRTVRFGLYGINASITSNVLIGNFFVLNYASIMLGIGAVITTTMLNMAFQAFFQPLGAAWFAYPAIIICIISYLVGDSFPDLIPVDILKLTVPEDHLRRVKLSQIVLKQFRLSAELDRPSKITPQKLKCIEESLLPILMNVYAKLGATSKMRELLDLNADPDCPSYHGRSPVHIAAGANQIKIVKLLQNWNADINKTDNSHNTPLFEALRSGHSDMARYLASRGGTIGLPRSDIASTLCNFVSNGDLDSLKLWLECGVDPSLQDYDYRSPLHIAYSRQNKEAMRLLEFNNADKNLRDRWGSTPLQCFGSTVSDNLKSCEDLAGKLEYQPPISASLENADISGEYISKAVRAFMSSEKFESDLENELYSSVVCALVHANETPVIQEMIRSGRDVMVTDYDDRTPLHLAASVGDQETVQLLLWNGADPNTLDRFGHSPLFEALQHKRDDICSDLRSSGAKLCLTKEVEVSTLCWAVYHNEYDKLTRLAANGADFNGVDYDGRSCVDIARATDNKNMVKFVNSLVTGLKKKKCREDKTEGDRSSENHSSSDADCHFETNI